MAKPIVTKTLKDYRCQLGEGPHWQSSTNSLVLVDIQSKSVLRWRDREGTMDVSKFDDTVSAVVPLKNKPDEYILSEGNRLLKYNWNTGGKEVVAELKDAPSTIRFNDGKCDPTGRFFSGTMERARNADDGKYLCALYSLEPGANKNAGLTKRMTDVGLSNGLDWTRDGSTMFYIDSKRRNVRKFEYNAETTEMSNPQVIYNNLLRVPDGLTIDSKNNVWVAFLGSSCISNIDTETGKVIMDIKFPTPNITSCCFGGDNLDILYATSDRSMLAQDDNIGGSTFAVLNTGARGLSAIEYPD